MSKNGLWWKIPLALLGVVSGIVLLLLIAVATALYTPSIRTKILHKGIAVAQEKTGMDIDLGQIRLSPFHHSPMVLYRAYKGQEDLPIEVQIDSLFVGHRGQDTLAYVHALRLKAIAKTSEVSIQDFTSLPIIVEHLQLDQTTFHSDSLIAAVGIDAIVGHLELSSPEILIAEGKYPLHGLHLYDADVAIDLRGTPPDTTALDTTPLLLAFDIPDGELRNIHYAMTPLNLDIRTEYLSTEALVDVGANIYDARRLNVGGFVFGLNQLRIPADTIYGNANVQLHNNLITSDGLHIRSTEIGAAADLYATEMDLGTMRIEVTGDAEYQGSKANLRASYDIDDEIYDAMVHIERVNLSPFLKDSTRIVLAGDIEAQGQGINPKRPMVSRVQAYFDEAIYGPYNFSHTSFKGATDSVTSLALTMPGFNADIQSPMPLFALIDRIQPLVETAGDSTVLHALTSLEDLSVLDTIRRKIPPIKADVTLRKGSPIQALIDSTGLDFDKVALALRSDSSRTTLALSPITIAFTQLDLPPVKSSMEIRMTEGHTNAMLAAIHVSRTAR